MVNDKLAAALAQKTEFTQEEWDAFGINNLRADHYIKSGGACFQPFYALPSKWQVIERPEDRVEFNHTQLAKALGKTKFSPAEWDMFGISDPSGLKWKEAGMNI